MSIFKKLLFATLFISAFFILILISFKRNSDNVLYLNSEVRSHIFHALHSLYQMQYGSARIVSSINELLVIKLALNAQKQSTAVNVEKNLVNSGQSIFLSSYKKFKENYDWLNNGKEIITPQKIALLNQKFIALNSLVDLIQQRLNQDISIDEISEYKEALEEKEDALLSFIDTLIAAGNNANTEISKKSDNAISSLNSKMLLLGILSLAMLIGYALYITKILKQNIEIHNSHLQQEKELAHFKKVESLGVLAGGMAHELNNQLQPVLSMSDLLLQQTQESDPHYKKIQLINDGALRAKDTVSKVLTFSRSDIGNVHHCEITNIVKKITDLVQISLPKGIHFQCHSNNSIGKVKMSATDLEGILINLITNAIHAMENQEGLISLDIKTTASQSTRDSYVQMTVSDEGSGISPNNLDKIFDPFFTTKEVGRGTGLGLYQSKNLIESAGGAIKANSEVGKGTQFTFSLPLIPTNS